MNVARLAKQTFSQFSKDKCTQMAASLAYAIVFALPSLLLLILYIVGLFVNPQDFRGQIVGQVQQLMGADGARMIEGIITQANRPGSGLMGVVGIIMLVVGATGAFAQLQDALNTSWEVKPDPKRGGIKNLIVKRILSFGMIVVIGFLLLVSFVLSAAISTFMGVLQSYLGNVGAVVAQVVQLVVGFLVTWVLFSALFKVLPDAEISWKDVRFGAFMTAILFTAGRFLIGLYLGHNHSLSAFGAAAALAVLLVWIYYAALIVLIGAEFTQVWARNHGRAIKPQKGVIRDQVVEAQRRSA